MPKGATGVRSLEEAVTLARQQARALGVDEVCVIGGGEIYRQAIGAADILHITEVSAEVDGDTRFPLIDPGIFEKIVNEPLPQGEKDSHAMRFLDLASQKLSKDNYFAGFTVKLDAPR